MTELKRELGVFSCTLLVAGNMIGIGIFVTAGRITFNLPDPKWILLAWVFGGFLSLAGALVYAELSSRFPRAGGGYVFLREAFGPLLGFLSGFSSSIVTLPGAAAFLAIGVTKYAGILDPVIAKTVAIALIVSISMVNYWGVKLGADLQDSFMVFKFLLIFLLISAGVLSGNGSLQNFSISQPLPYSLWVAFPLAMVPIMYTYSGWDATVYVAGEVKNPSRTIPISLFFGTLLVTFTYLALTSLYIYALPVTSSENQVKIVTAAGNVFFGPRVGGWIGWIVSLSVLGCLSATILTGPRVLYAMAKDNLFPHVAFEVHPTFATPGKAILIHGALACLLALTGTFNQLLDYVTVPSLFFATLAALGLFVLRAKNHADPQARPYLSFGYPVLPALFICGMSWIILRTVLTSYRDSLWGLAIVLMGIPLYFIWTQRSARVFHKPYASVQEEDLVQIPSDLTRHPEKNYLALPEAQEALGKMCSEAVKEGVRIVVISSYRTLEFQKAYFEDAEKRHGKGKGAKWVAPSGYSEHHTGYVFDLADQGRPETDDEPSFESTPASDWLKGNAGRFGFELSFPKGNGQGVGFEPWHWRFIGSPKAKGVFYF